MNYVVKRSQKTPQRFLQLLSGNIMLDSQLLNQVMNEIDDAFKSGHLISQVLFIQRHRFQRSLAEMQNNTTTNPYFDELDVLNATYRVKANMSASQAIDSLLQSHETAVDCGVTMIIMYYKVVLRMMEQKWGVIDGRKRFDALFGSVDATTPIERRLIISPVSIVMGTEYIPQMELLPVQPLSFLADTQLFKSKQEMEAAVKVGYQVLFEGDPNYLKLHPAGAFAAYNCVVTSVNPLKVRSSDIPGKELTEDDLFHHHIQAYSQTPTFESFSLVDQQFRNSTAYLALSKTPTTKEKIPGYNAVFFSIDMQKLEFLLSAPIAEVVAILDKHITTMTQTCLGYKAEYVAKQFQKEAAAQLSSLTLTSSTNSTHKAPVAKAAPAVANPLQAVSNEFSGLSGLRGAFVKPAAKPAAAPATAAQKAAANKKDSQDGFMSGLRPGFLK